MHTFQTIYKRDSNGNVRIWYAELDGDKYRTVAGIKDGNLVTSGWTTAKETNIGRSNGRSAEEQAEFEVNALYEHQLSREYHENEADIDKPKFFKPMLAHKYDGFKPGYTQPKLDGVRCIVSQRGMFSREGKPIVACPHIYDQLAPLFEQNPDLIFDGELYNHEFKDDFNQIISLIRKQNVTDAHLSKTAELVQYHVYDLASHPGTFHDRYHELSRILLEAGLNVRDGRGVELVPTYLVLTEESFDEKYGSFLEEGYEGGMWRDRDALYEQKRSKSLLKRKDFQDAEFECVRIEEGNGNWAGLAKRVICRLPDGREFGAGIKGNMARAKELLNETHKYVTVQYFALTPAGIPRFPVVTKFWGEGRDL